MWDLTKNGIFVFFDILVIFDRSILFPCLNFYFLWIYIHLFFCLVFFRNVHFFIFQQRSFCSTYCISYFCCFLNFVHRFVSCIWGNFHRFLRMEGTAASGWHFWPCFLNIGGQVMRCPRPSRPFWDCKRAGREAEEGREEQTGEEGIEMGEVKRKMDREEE